MGMSSAMIHGVLPGFLMSVIGVGTVTIGAIEGIAESTCSFMKIFSGGLSDWIGRRKPLVLLGYGLSALTKPLFPLAGAASTVLLARFLDRVGKGLRDAPRDALLTDITPVSIRGAGFGLRGALYTVGSVAGPLAAIALMAVSHDDFRLVFWTALIPAGLSVLVLAVGVQEPNHAAPASAAMPLQLRSLEAFGPAFWWTVAVAAVFSLARFSPAFLLLKAAHIGIDASLVPLMFVLMNSAYSVSAYPCGVLADRIDVRVQLGLGAAVLAAADLVLASADSVAVAAVGAVLWGLQMGITQGLLSAAVANAAPAALRGTAFGLYELIVGIATLLASTGAGALWAIGGPGAVFATGGALAIVTAILLAATPRRGLAGAVDADQG
jgi:MFS family permease